MSGDSIGMMEGAFFVSKGVILDWMNDLLDVSGRETNRIHDKYNIADFLFYSCNSPKSSSARPGLSTAR